MSFFFLSSRQLLEREKQDLLNEMMALPQNAVVRRINELVKRARSVKVRYYPVSILHIHSFSHPISQPVSQSDSQSDSQLVSQSVT